MDIIREARISEDGIYRYTLYREWAEDPYFGVRVLNFVMLNPSTADANKDDPTIRKCIGFAKLNEYTAVRVVNLFAFRATDPKKLKAEYDLGGDVVGSQNDSHVREIPEGETVVAAWGSSFQGKWWLENRIRITKNLLNRDLWCLKKTKEGRPWHPLYVPYGEVIRL